MKSSLFSLRSFLINKLSVIWLTFLGLSFLSLFMSVVFHNKLDYLGSSLYPLQNNLYNLRELVEQNKNLLNTWYGKPTSGVKLQINKLIKLDLPIELNNIQSMIKSNPRSHIKINLLSAKFKRLVMQERNVLSIQASKDRKLLKKVNTLIKNVFKDIESLQAMIDSSIKNNQDLINVIYKQAYDYSIAVLCVIFGMLILFTIWGMSFIRHISKLIISSTDTLIKNSKLSTQECLESNRINSGRLKEFVSEVPLEFSVGVSSFSNQANHINQLLAYARFADIKAAKKYDRFVQIFDFIGEKERIRISKLERDLFFAMQKQQIFLVFQPQIDLRTNQIVGCEALMRWHHPKYGVIPPFEFISIAEKNFEIIELGRFIQDKALSFYSKWAKLNNNKFKIAINASLVEINTQSYPNHLLSLAKRYNVPPSSIEIEITETVADDNFNLLDLNIKRIRSLGFLVAIDDFGTGYSSLERLQNLKIDLLKIDRTFLDNNFHKNKSMGLLKIMFNLGEIFEIDCLVEGVETAIEAAYSKALGIQYAQGFFFYPPLTEDEMTELLKKQDRRKFSNDKK